jgi:two-component system, LuxR family, response regulator FixJ
MARDGSKSRSIEGRERAKKLPQNVILVEDDAHVRQALGRLLRSAGFSVTAFERPAEALISRLPTQQACLILDIYMPEMTGIELCHALKSRGLRIPTILITGHQDDHAVALAKEIKAVALLYKPLEEKKLLETIERALGQKVISDRMSNRGCRE